MDRANYTALAELLEFPAPGLIERGRALLARLRADHAAGTAELERFLDALPTQLVDQQELHTRTFDVQSLTTLDAGYVLFGDDYKRGALLSHLSREHLRAGNDCRGELADHLPNLLRLLSVLDDTELRGELAEQIMVPALLLMIREFDPERIAKKNASYRKHFKTLIDPARAGDASAYLGILQALLAVLERDFAVSATVARLSAWSARPPQSDDFLRRVEREMDIERHANPVNSGGDA